MKKFVPPDIEERTRLWFQLFADPSTLDEVHKQLVKDWETCPVGTLLPSLVETLACDLNPYEHMLPTIFQLQTIDNTLTDAIRGGYPDMVRDSWCQLLYLWYCQDDLLYAEQEVFRLHNNKKK